MIATIISSLVCAAIAACLAYAWTARHYRQTRQDETGDWAIRWVPAERAPTEGGAFRAGRDKDRGRKEIQDCVLTPLHRRKILRVGVRRGRGMGGKTTLRTRQAYTK